MKKIILLFLSIVCICCTILALTACNSDNKSTDSSNNQGQVSTHEHKYVEKVTLPTCTEKGFTTYTCECGDSYIDNYVDKTAHTEEWKTDIEATCISAGSKHKECSVCKTILAIEVVQAKGHTEVVDKEVVATCTATGLTEGKHCSVCNEVLVKQETVDKLPHTAGDWMVDVKATCTAVGSKHKECSKCKEVLVTKGVPALGHDYSASICSRCGENLSLIYSLNSDGQGYTVTGISAFFTGENIVIPQKFNNLPVTSIGNDAFAYCTGLTSITIPNSVTSIGNDAFKNCTGLTNITIPNSVTSIGDFAFKNCTGLTSITIPNSVTSIGDYAFQGCSGLTSINVDKNNKVFHSQNNCLIETVTKTLILGCQNSVIPDDDSVTSIGDYTFDGCTGLTSIIIPNRVTSIGDSAFRNCCKLVEVYNLSSLNITKGSSTNGYVGYYALDVYTSLDTPSKLVTNSEGYIFYENGEEVYLFEYKGDETNLVLPDKYNNKNYGIYNLAFSGCNSLTSVTISNSVTEIGDYAFSSCANLTSITIPNSVTSIGENAFERCTGLTGVTIPDSVTSIGNWAFSCCTGLTSVMLPDSVTSIGQGAFSNCAGLTSITIPNSVTSIGNFTFGYCTSLTSVTIPNSVTSIGDFAFAYCTGLTSIIIPNSVTSIGDSAFRNCTGLTKVYYIGTAEEWNKIVIGSSNDSLSNAKIYYYTETEPTMDGNYWRYDEKGNIIEVPQPVREIWMDFSQLGNAYKDTEFNQVYGIFTITNGKGKITAGKTVTEGKKADTVFTGSVQLGKNGSATNKCITFTVPAGYTSVEFYAYMSTSNVEFFSSFVVEINGVPNTMTSASFQDKKIAAFAVTVKEGDTITVYSSAENATNIYGILIK